MKGEEVLLRGMVVSQSPFSEDSAICSLATDDGIVPLLLGHVYRPKSPLKPLLLVGSIVSVQAMRREKGPFLAKQANVETDSSRCLATLEGNAFLLLVQEVSRRLYEYGDRFPYGNVRILLDALMEGKDLLSLSLLFLGSVYQSLGMEMETSRCVFCKKTENIVSYSVREGGYVCRDCLERAGASRKENMELFVFKFAFLPIGEETLSKRVPPQSGRRVLVQLCLGLCDYFDFREFKTLPFLLEQCRKEGDL